MKEGKKSFEHFCGTCHPFDTPLSAAVEPGGWEKPLDEMSSRDPSLGSSESSLIVSYLESRSLFEKKCAACHDRDRCLSRKKTHSDWLLTVKKMALLAEGGIRGDEAVTIADYLSVVCPAGKQP